MIQDAIGALKYEKNVCALGVCDWCFATRVGGPINAVCTLQNLKYTSVTAESFSTSCCSCSANCSFVCTLYGAISARKKSIWQYEKNI